MSDNDLEKYCRYYPFDFERNAVAYFYEKQWLLLGGKYPLNEYYECGLESFSTEDGVPETLKALLLNRFLLSNGYFTHTVDLFKLWYETFYLQNKS